VKNLLIILLGLKPYPHSDIRVSLELFRNIRLAAE